MEKKIKGFYFDFMPLGHAIKQARKEMKISREKLAEEAGYGTRHIQAIENDGQFPSVELLVWFVQKYHISLDQYIFQMRSLERTP